MKRYETRIVHNNGLRNEVDYDKLGMEGWELVQVTSNSSYFKRLSWNETQIIVCRTCEVDRLHRNVVEDWTCTRCGNITAQRGKWRG